MRLRRYPSGSTGVVCFMMESNIITANVGDSRAILVREETVINRCSSADSRRESVQKSYCGVPETNENVVDTADPVLQKP